MTHRKTTCFTLQAFQPTDGHLGSGVFVCIVFITVTSQNLDACVEYKHAYNDIGTKIVSGEETNGYIGC